ncbi:hypothetical protein [Allomesorhizobium alhagi]|uniref:Uncharacterized protein n=1 Tax=Mesorhizobium alhagi CCNWXJ12-2 TaxID=1107882 RepID=H0HKP5_9HYPH|nr:hypothetical protein [Mesorhizobium alhagi]EHK58743.1 hypothetical protein MAXJ12_03513 [Mesorhizobium alhagi CCNWXJ12-2]
MDKRITVAFWAIDILLLAGPFVMPGIPIEVAWFAVVMAVGMLVYSLFPRRFLPKRWRGESPSFDTGKHPMTKATLLGLKPGAKIDGLKMDGNVIEGYDQASLAELESGAEIKDGVATKNEIRRTAKKADKS